VSRKTLVAVSAAAALVLGGGLAAALSLSSGGTSKATTTVTGADRLTTLLDGIEQHGAVLGSPSAPVTLVEFADPQCPYCAEWEARALPGIVTRYVRTGKVQIHFNGMTFVGADSETAFRTALAAGQQGRFWNVLTLLFANQGTENAGWVTDALLHAIGTAVPGLDTQQMLDARDSATVNRGLADAAALAETAGITSTPAFAVGKTGGALRVVQLTSLDASGITPALDAALSQ